VVEGGHGYYLSAVGPSGAPFPERGEAPGTWLGRGSSLLGLAGAVDGDGLGHLLRGADPRSGEPMVPLRWGRLAGLDLLFAAPKSLSVVHGLSDEPLSAALARGHDRAVAGALGYLEAHACVVRQGPGHRAVGEGFVAAGFRHRTSRADDPHLHTHVVTVNAASGPEGRWSALHTPLVFAELRATAAVYHAALRSEVDQLGLRWVEAGGRWELAGVARPVIDAFSRRRAQILAELAEQSQRSGSLEPVSSAARRTRPAKIGLVDYAALVPLWQDRASDIGFDVNRLDTARRSANVAVASGDAALADLGDVFGRADVVRSWADHLPRGASPRELERAAEAVLRDGAVPLPRRPGVGRWDGPRPSTRYTSPAVLALRDALVSEPIATVTGPRLDRLDAVDRLRVASPGLVVAAARGRAAAVDFEAATGVPSGPAEIVTAELGRRRGRATVVVVADADRWATAALVGVVAAARAAHAEVVMVGGAGSSGPLPSAFAEVLRSSGSALLPPDASVALSATVSVVRGTLTVATSAAEARRLLVADWAAARSNGREAVMVARSREEVDALDVLGGAGSAVLAGDAWRSGAAPAYVLGSRVPFRSRDEGAPAHRYVVAGRGAPEESIAETADRWMTIPELDALGSRPTLEVAESSRLRAQATVRAAALARAAELSGPAWLIDGAGRPPRGPVERAMWREGVEAVVTYRDRWRVQDHARGLGPERVDGLAARAERNRVEQVVRLACPGRIVAREGPGLDR
jgi:conjugative relaxase-like TrwC/TraI family protein